MKIAFVSTSVPRRCGIATFTADLKAAVQAADPADAAKVAASHGPRYCSTRKTTIYAGSNEIQRNIIAKMTLGL